MGLRMESHATFNKEGKPKPARSKTSEDLIAWRTEMPSTIILTSPESFKAVKYLALEIVAFSTIFHTILKGFVNAEKELLPPTFKHIPDPLLRQYPAGN
jgi:hypothetical protein